MIRTCIATYTVAGNMMPRILIVGGGVGGWLLLLLLAVAAVAVALAGGVVVHAVGVVVVVVVVLPGPTKSAPHQGMDTRIASQVIDQLGKGLRWPLR